MVYPFLFTSQEFPIAAPTFFFSAAEHSGDALGASLIAALRRLHPDARFVGIGGPRMAAAGCTLLAEPVGRSAMLIGALTQYRYWLALFKQVEREIETLRPAVVIPIDSSFVNLRMAQIAKRRKIPVCYYVAPQLWASRPWRIGKLKRRVDTLCCILPFEQEYFSSRGMHAVYVGHPMFDTPADIPETDPRRLDPPLPDLDPRNPNNWQTQTTRPLSSTDSPRIALFPGSRKAEIDANLPPMLDVIADIKGHFPKVSFVAVAPSEERAWQIRKYLAKSSTPVDVRTASDAVLRWADLVLTKSGTVVLQAARHHKPMIVMFAVAWYKWHLFARHLITTPYICLVNILAARELVPEYVPFYGSTLPLARRAITLLEQTELRRTMSKELAELVRPLQPGPDHRLAADRVAAEVTKLM